MKYRTIAFIDQR